MSDLLKKIENQDNRYTKLPIYYVIKRKHWAPCWEGHADQWKYYCCDGIEYDDHIEVIESLVDGGYIEPSERDDYDVDSCFEKFGINHIPVRYEEYESELDPIFLTEERAKAFCDNDRDPTAVTYVKHAGPEIKELIEMAKRAERAEARVVELERIMEVAKLVNPLAPETIYKLIEELER